MASQSKKLLLLLAGVFLGLVLSLGSGVFAQKGPREEALPWDDARLLAEVLERVRLEYVESVDDSVLIESAVRGMVTDLDPHSQFLNSAEYEEVRISTTGNYSGVGLEVHMENGVVVVVAAIEGTPAEKAGLSSGDIIVEIDGITLDEDNFSEAINHMRGEPGTNVVIAVLREPESEPIEYKLTRNNVQVKSVRHELLEDNYGYVRITHFSDTTPKDTRKAIRQLRHKSNNLLRGVVIDLRNNPGGVLDAAIDVSDEFLDEGLIMSASGRGPDASFSHMAHDGDILDGVQIVVLVNGGSASSSEIVAGALQDNDRATIVGVPTFGKGSVQTVMPLSNGRAIKLTTSRYFTPSGASIHGRGITPDVAIQSDPTLDLLASITAHQTDPGAALLQGDTQLRKALAVLKKGNIIKSAATRISVKTQ
ncbi:MAG: S41 family peptidase [Gammaproteobacteria bacterium]|nr:S41 family peptidase [Gammaproteobacteria bacterium]MCP4090913.1 S41 family peptidase [Gammaproteobacteria bacterium]MCP4275200.1 S41 family peptidase [Gammaproteobacteria bacterium]MCP4830790.1 S41 family peptidase [Gammaproteobacteria bacterium]MCP4929579.1 S41 family peptidase [Gammaproteobacteria bacterium]